MVVHPLDFQEVWHRRIVAQAMKQLRLYEHSLSLDDVTIEVLAHYLLSIP